MLFHHLRSNPLHSMGDFCGCCWLLQKHWGRYMVLMTCNYKNKFLFYCVLIASCIHKFSNFMWLLHLRIKFNPLLHNTSQPSGDIYGCDVLWSTEQKKSVHEVLYFSGENVFIRYGSWCKVLHNFSQTLCLDVCLVHIDNSLFVSASRLQIEGFA